MQDDHHLLESNLPQLVSEGSDIIGNEYMNKDEAYATSPSKSIQKKQLSPDKDAVEDELANELSEEKERLDDTPSKRKTS